MFTLPVAKNKIKNKQTKELSLHNLLTNVQLSFGDQYQFGVSLSEHHQEHRNTRAA